MDISLPVIIGPLGILFGWTLNQLSQGFTSTKDDRKVRNQVLFNLLNIYHILNSLKLDVTVVQKILFDEIRARDPTFTPDKKLTQEFYEVFQPIFSQFLNTRATEEIKGLEESYEKSVALLAPVDPIIAYSLSGQSSQIKYIFLWMNSLIEGIKPHMSDTSALEKDEPELRGILQDKMVGVYLKDMKELIEDLSSQIGWRTRRRVNSIFTKQTGPIGAEPEFKLLIQELFNNIQQKFANT